MDYNQLKTDIVEFIRTNNNEEITGEVLQHILISMVDALGKGYQFAGVATPHTLIPQTDEKVVWLLGSGNYENFGDPFVVAENEFAVMMYDDSFELEKIAVGRPVDSEITEDGINPVEGRAIYEKFAGVEEDILQLDEAKQDKLELDQHPTEGSDNPVTSAGVYEADMLLQQAIEAILLLIPSAASELNKLADKNFVNSSIETATATFRGTYNLVTDLELQVGATHQYIGIALSMAITDADNNDYAFVQVPTSDETPTEIAVTQRYKYNGTNWDYEYDLNNSGFTAAQWEAINSGINDLLVGKLADLPTLTELTALFDETRESLESLNDKVSENTSDIAQLRALYEALQQSEPEVIAPTATWPVEDPSGTVIYRVVDRENTPPEYYSDYMWNGTEMVLMARYNNAVDDRPKKGSTNFVESGGIFDNMGALDISELNATEDPHTPAVYEGLSAAIAAVPSDYQAGGISVKFKNEENEYEYHQLTSAEWSTDINDWISINLIKELDAQAGATKYEDIPFSVEKQYIKKQDEKGEIAFSNNQNITQYIPVSEGDEFLYSGVTPANSLSVAGYEYTNGAYVFKDTLVLSTGSVAVEDKYIIIPAGITHIVACCNTTALSSSSFRKIKKSSLEKLKENLGETGSQTIYEASAYTLGQYVNASGSWTTNDSAKSLMLEVKDGDIIELYETTGNSNVCTFAKKITETTFEPLLILDSGVLYEKVSYNVAEDMSLCISVGSTIDTPRMTVVRNDMKSDIENLKDTQEYLVAYNKWLEEYDIKLGVMFENIAVIGDSMSRGTLSVVGDTEDTNSFGASYLSCLAKRWNCKSLFHYAKSGTSTYGWLNDAQYGIGRLLADAANGKIYNAYFIAYGHNDGGDTTHIPTVGSATDTAATVDTSGAVPSCASGNSFCAYYKAIIDNIRAVAPHAMIFCLSEYDNVMTANGRAEIRQAIIDIAEWYYEEGDKLVHHLETGGVPVPDMGLGTHYSTVGYDYIARRIDNEVNKVIYAHRDDEEIKYFGSYNTDKTANSPWGSNEVNANTCVLDISELNATENPHTLATYADLSAALADIPDKYKTGGLKIQYVSSSDNNYVQYRLTAQNFTTDVTQWQGVDDEPTAGSQNLVTSGGVERASEGSLFYDMDGKTSNNLINSSITWTDGKCVSTLTGQETQGVATLSCSSKIPVVGGRTIQFMSYTDGGLLGGFLLCVYDSNDNVLKDSNTVPYFNSISHVNGLIYQLVLPQNAKSVRINIKTVDKAKAFVKYNYSSEDKLSLYWLEINEANLNQALEEKINSIGGEVLPDRIYGDDFVFNEINVQISDYTEGGYINAGTNPIVIVTSQAIHSAIVNCQAGDEFLVYCNYAPDSANAPYYYGFGSINAPMTPAIDRLQYPNYISYYSEGVYKVVIPEGCSTFYLTVADRNRRDDLIRTIVDKKTLKWLLINGNNIGSETISQIVTELIGDENFDEVVKTIAKNENDSNAALYHTWDSIRKPIVFTGKSISAYGDSITQGTCSPNLGNAGDNMYIKQFCNFAGTNTPNNRAIGGSCIADNENYDAQYAIYKRIKENASDTDIIWIAGGTNDFNQGVPVGSYDSTDVATFYGALRNMCEWLKTNRPNAVVIFVTPIPYTKPESAYPSHVAPLDAYRSAIYDIATEYEYNVVDGKSLGMPRMQGNWNNYMCVDSDGCHPTIYGHRLMARNLCGKLL